MLLVAMASIWEVLMQLLPIIIQIILIQLVVDLFQSNSYQNYKIMTGVTRDVGAPGIVIVEELY